MAPGRERDRSKESFWRRVLQQCQHSGQGVRAFCEAHGLSEHSFYAWRRTIQERDRQDTARSRRESGPASNPVTGDGRPAFVPVTIAAGPAPLEVVLGDGRVVRVPAPFDAATLRQLLNVLAEAPSC
jgi:transposase-like protein